MTLAYAELRRLGRLAPRLGDGCRFGIVLWLSVLPTTALGSVLRLTGLHPRMGYLELPTELAVAAASGAVLGHLWGKSKRATITLAIAVLGLVVAMAGPIPVTNGLTPTLLLLGFIPLFVSAGIILSLSARFLVRPDPRSASQCNGAPDPYEAPGRQGQDVT